MKGGLRIALLGSPIIEVDGVPLVVDTRMAVALMAYLARYPEPQSRETLATLLWPEYDQDSARANLRRTLSALKRGLGGRWLAGERARIALERSPEVRIDLDAFAESLRSTTQHGHTAAEVCSACIDSLTHAAESIRGPFLSGFTLRESAAFDDWQAQEAAAYQRQYLDVLERLTRALAARGDFTAALPFASRWLAADPLDEPAHCRLMLLLAWSGKRSAAWRQYQECVRVLERELGVTPMPETRELARLIQARQEPAPFAFARATTPVEVKPITGAQLRPFVGREAEWTQLAEAYTGSAAASVLVALRGEAGVGKTRLANEFVDALRRRGARALAIDAGTSESHPGYAALASALRAELRRDSNARARAMPRQVLAEVARLLPELGDEPVAQSTDSPLGHERFVGALVLFIETLLAGDATPVVLADDAHRADDASLELLERLARPDARPVCVVLTYRPDELASDHRLQRFLANQRRMSQLVEISVDRLNPEATRVLAVAIHPDLPDSRLNEIVERTGGLPYFVVEYTRALRRDSTSALPETIRDLLSSRLACVPYTIRPLLNAAAVIGRQFHSETLQSVCDATDEVLAEALEHLAELDVIQEVAECPGGFEFKHAWMHELVYAELSSGRRRLLHRRTAEILLESTTATSGAAEVAAHLEAAGDSAHAAELYFEAGQSARRLLATGEALAHFQRALALGHGARAMLHEAIGDLQTVAGRYVDALTSLHRAAALCAPSELPRVEHKVANLYCRRGEWESADRHYVAAEAELDACEDEASRRARLYADWSLAFARRNDVRCATQLAARALEAAERADDGPALAAAHNALGVLALRGGDIEASLVHHQRSLALAEVLDDTEARIAALNNLALAQLAANDLAAALAAGTAALNLCLTLGDRHHLGALHNNLADVLRACDRTEEAMAHVKQAMLDFSFVGSGGESLQPAIWNLTEW